MISQQKKPTNKFSAFMEKAGWSVVSFVLGSVIVFAITTIWLGNVHILNFNWLMLILGVSQVMITVFLVWYCLKAIGKLGEKYQADVAALDTDNRAFQANFRDMMTQEFNRLNQWAIDYTQANAKEQAERLEEVKNACKQDVATAKTELTGVINSHSNNFSNWATNHADGHVREQKELIRKLDDLEQELKVKKGL